MMMLSKNVVAPKAFAPSAPRLPLARPGPVCVRAAKQDEPMLEQKGKNVALATILASALITSAIVPDEALAAKSGGRVGGSGGFRSSKAATRAAPQQ